MVFRTTMGFHAMRRDRCFPVSALLDWYGRWQRDLPWRRANDIYRIWVSEVMLQQTQSATVIPYYRLFLKHFPSLGRLARAALQEVLKVWEGLGYYSRARNLRQAARLVQERHHGRVPRDAHKFRSLPGVGDYIAAAVLSIADHQRLPVVDGNVLRVFCRWSGLADDIGRTATKKKIFNRLLSLMPAKSPGDFNQALMELGALVCLPRNPLCPMCPLRQACTARVLRKTDSLPVKKKRPPVPLHRVALGVIDRQEKIYVQRRPDIGHLGGLWEFPGGKARPGETMTRALKREIREELGIVVGREKEIAVVKHGYSHFKVDCMCSPAAGCPAACSRAGRTAG